MTTRILVGDCRERGDGRFKPGQHWRPHMPYWDRDWLVAEYLTKQRSCAAIGGDFGVTGEAIMAWLRRHGIPRRSMSETRAIKRWGLEGESNPMFGRIGSDNPNWKGGVTPERQAFYASLEWRRAARTVQARDKGICRRCGANAKGSSALHHVIPFGNTSHRASADNLVTLCKVCHDFVHSKANVTGELIGKEV